MPNFNLECPYHGPKDWCAECLHLDHMHWRERAAQLEQREAELIRALRGVMPYVENGTTIPRERQQRARNALEGSAQPAPVDDIVRRLQLALDELPQDDQICFVDHYTVKDAIAALQEKKE